MLATGGSAVRALHHLKWGREPATWSSCASSPPRRRPRSRPSTQMLSCGRGEIDRESYQKRHTSRPGPGDAGDRVFGTY